MKIQYASLVLPMFNEIDYVEKTISKALSVLESILCDFEIIIVDDASYDGSEKIVDDLAANNPKIKVIHHKNNRKLGGSLRTGFRAASKQIVIYTDMDMPFDFCLLRELVPLMDSADIINGYRRGARESFRRIFYSKAYNLLIRGIFGLKVKDVNFAMKIFRKVALDSLKLKSEGSFISAEALIKAQYLGYKIKEAAVPYLPRQLGCSRLMSYPVILKIIFEMIKFFPEIVSFKLKRRMSGVSLKANLHNYFRRISCPFELIEKHIPDKGDIYDFGCGYGIFLDSLTRFSKEDSNFIGLDIDKAKIVVASKANKAKNVRFEVRDITENLNITHAACIIMVDALMLIPFFEQEILLKRCFNYLCEKGILVIKDINTRPLLKYIWHQFQETLVLKVFKLIQGKGLFCRPCKSYTALLEKIGYKVQVINIHKNYLYPHILYICAKN